MSGQDNGPGGYPPPPDEGYGRPERPGVGQIGPQHGDTMGGQRSHGAYPPGGTSPGGPQGPGGPGGYEPGGLPPEPERRGPSAAVIVTIIVLAIALIILAVWWFMRDEGQENAEPGPAPTSSAPVATEEPTAEPTASEEPTADEPTSDENTTAPMETQEPTDDESTPSGGGVTGSPGPAPVPSAPSVDPGDDFNVEDYEILPDTLPPTIGDWQHTMVGGFDAYLNPDGAYVMVAGQGKDEEQIDAFRALMSDVREFDGGFCGTLEDDGLGSFDQCYFLPGGAPDRFYNVMSADEVPLDDLQEIAEAIATFE